MFDFNGPFCVIRRRGDHDLLVLEGPARSLSRLDEIPRKSDPDPRGAVYDTVCAVPFAQIKERGYEAHEDDASIMCLDVERQSSISMDEFIANFEAVALELDEEVAFCTAGPEYEKIIEQIINDEIGEGEGANFVIGRRAAAKISNMSTSVALTIFRRLVRREFGAHWTFVFFDGEKYLIGSTPERHLGVAKKRVRMNPISGTFRKRESYASPREFKKALLDFVTDEKEIYELFMVVDEELKMMARFCEHGGLIIGPLLKEMSRVIHTEYLLSGETNVDMMDVFRDSMYAATVVGSPVQNACRIITRYEPNNPRRYFASALLLIGRDEEGGPTLDSPILIRTAEISTDGDVSMQVGATLVRNSVPADEVRETEAKLSAMMRSLQPGLDNEVDSTAPTQWLPELYNDDEVNECLQERNLFLSRFWFLKQDPTRDFAGQKVTIIDNEDDFCHMMAVMLKRLGLSVKVVACADYDPATDDSDLPIVGPGPGDPNDPECPRITQVRKIIDALHDSKRKFMAVCLGHQVLCLSLGLRVKKKQNPYQGTQEHIDYFGRPERVGFYNTFAGEYPGERGDLEFSYEPQNNEIHAVRSELFLGMQFHAESILTTNGARILREAIEELLATT